MESILESNPAGVATNPDIAAVMSPLPVRAALKTFIRSVQSNVSRAAEPVDASDEERDRRRRVVLAFLTKLLESPRLDSTETFEKILNGCLSLGYRARPLAAFAFSALEGRFAARIRRRLIRAGMLASPDDLADVVASTAETLARLIRDARRSEYTFRYALLISIADHRAVDFLRARRRRPETIGLPEGDFAGGDMVDVWGSSVGQDPESALQGRERQAVALTVRDAVFAAVNDLPTRERAALIAVELEGLGYAEISERLELSATDVGNVVRRARLLRDRALLPHLRALPLVGTRLGFARLQSDKELRLQMVRWSVDVGSGACRGCARDRGHLHDAAGPCLDA